MADLTFFAPTSLGLESVLAAELAGIGAGNVVVGSGGVAFTGDRATCYRANLHLRTAIRVLMRIAEFVCASYDELYENTRAIDWGELMTLTDTLAVDCNVRDTPGVTHSQYGSRRVKDAVVDQFRDKTGQRPNVDPENPTLKINVHISRGRCVLSLDSSGVSLHMRGYRTLVNEAPLKETLACGLLAHAGWQETGAFADPFCGTGTIVIEAALQAKRMAPGLMGRQFGFQRWRGFDARLWRTLVEEAEARVIPKPDCRIQGSDIDPEAIRAARGNARSAGVDGLIQLSVADAMNFKPAEPCLIVTNPPYGERMGDPEELKGLYKQFGDTLKQNCKGSTAHIFIAGGTPLVKCVGLRSSRKVVVFNGPLEGRLVKYELF
ncbi:MAG: THUMP domain-containing protein [Planctomycetota bacterium]